ncbi:MAG: flagellar protein FlgN [Proteobacteria bacterium]|nr:flagellar protein FlgN [Pseudomonadota bacterium]
MSERALLVARVEQVLLAEEERYRELQLLLQAERVAVIDRDVPALERLVREKEALADEVRLLEESRIHACRRLGEALGIASESPTLEALTEGLGPDGASLAPVHARLSALLGAVRELVSENEGEAREAVARVRATLSILGRADTVASGYSAPGQSAPRGAGRLLQETA